MLKKNENRNSLLLWSEYIEIESLSNLKSNAKNTFETLLVSSSAAISGESSIFKEVWYFIRSYIDFNIGLQNHIFKKKEFCQDEILWILIHVGSKETFAPYLNQTVKPTSVLKAVSGFKQFLDQELSSLRNSDPVLCYCLDPRPYLVLDCIKCFAFLQYFTQGIDAALQIYKNYSVFLEKKINVSLKRHILEQFCILQTELLNIHTWNSISSIKPLQSYLYESINRYPSNAVLLYYLVKLRNASSVVGPTRRFFTKLLKNQNKVQPVVWIFALASELSICYSVLSQKSFETDQLNTYENIVSCWGIKWKIQALYEKALASESYCFIPVLWRSYLKYEILNGETSKAKGIFHEAIQNCGWSKELLMDGIKYFPEDVQQVIDFMIEKQIRIHTPLEEVTLLMEHGIQET
ncbi:hypothetical protein X975_09707, partial [Stegodyphus mimosarum]